MRKRIANPRAQQSGLPNPDQRIKKIKHEQIRSSGEDAASGIEREITREANDIKEKADIKKIMDQE